MNRLGGHILSWSVCLSQNWLWPQHGRPSAYNSKFNKFTLYDVFYVPEPVRSHRVEDKVTITPNSQYQLFHKINMLSPIALLLQMGMQLHKPFRQMLKRSKVGLLIQGHDFHLNVDLVFLWIYIDRCKLC